MYICLRLGQRLPLIVISCHLHTFHRFRCPEMMHQDAHFVISHRLSDETNIRGQDIACLYLPKIETGLAGILPFLITINRPILVVHMIIIASPIIMITLCLKTNGIFGHQLLFGHELCCSTGIGRQALIKREFHPIDGTRFRFNQSAQIDGEGIPLRQIQSGLIQENRLASHQAPYPCQRTGTVQLILLQEIAHILLQNPNHPYHDASQIDGLEGNGELIRLGNQHPFSYKSNSRDLLPDEQLTTLRFAQRVSISAPNGFTQQECHLPFAAWIRIET